MDQHQPVGGFTGFINQLRSNGLYLLMVLIATGALLYFIFGMIALIGR